MKKSLLNIHARREEDSRDGRDNRENNHQGKKDTVWTGRHAATDKRENKRTCNTGRHDDDTERKEMKKKKKLKTMKTEKTR